MAKNYRDRGEEDYKAGRYNPGEPGSKRSREYHEGQERAWKDEAYDKKRRIRGE